MTARLHRTCFVIATIFVVLYSPFASAQRPSGAPVLSSAETTADGYILVGSGFGNDASLVKILEGKTELPPSAVITFSRDRISVRSRSRGLIAHAVMVNGQKSAVLTVTHAEPTRLASLSMTPTSVEGGQPATMTIALGGPAPSSGAAISLSITGGVAATLPANANVPAGQNKTTVKIDTSVVSATTRLQISAAYAGARKTAQLEVRPKPADAALQSLAISPATVQSGGSTTATITLTAPAPPGGATLSITSSAAEVTVPATVTVPQASTTKTFSVQAASGLSVNVASTIRATLGSETPKSAQVIVTPASLGVSAITLNPSSVQGGRQVTGMVTISAAAPQGGTTVTVTSSHAEARPSTALVLSGLTSAAFNIATSNPASNVNATISAKIGSGTAKTAQLTIVATPLEIASVTLSPATVERGVGTIVSVDLTAAAPAGGATLNLSSSNPDAPLSSTITVGAGASRATVAFRTNETATPGTATITASLGSASSKSATLTITGPPEQPIHVDAITVSPASVPAGEAPLVTVTLSRAAPAGGTQVNLVSAVPGIASIAPSLTVAPGATSAQMRVTTRAVAGMASTVNVPITAAVGTAGSRQTTLTVQAPASVALTSLTLSSAVQSGTSTTGTVTLSAGAPDGGARFAISSSSAKAVVPATLTIPAGATSAPFTIQAGSVNDPVNVTITVQGNDADRKTAALTINPLPVSVRAVTVNPSTVVGGATATATVTLSSPAPAAGAAVTLSSSAQQATVPATVTVPGGSTSAQFTIQTGFPASVTTATLSAGVGSTTPKTAQMTISVAPPTSGTGTTEGVAGGVTMAAPPPSVHSIVMTNARFFVKRGMFVKFTGVTPDREARITGIGGSRCPFAEEQGQLPFTVQATPDGRPAEYGAGVVGTIIRSSRPPTQDVQCSIVVTFEWRPTGGTWQVVRDTRPLTVGGHEAVTVSNTWSLHDWLDPVGDIGLGDCLNGIKSHNGKLAFEVKATPLGADCPYAVLSTRNHDRFTDRNFNVLPEGVMLTNVTWRLETQGNGCCLGVSKNQSCAPLPQPPSVYTFSNVGSDMHPNTVRHSVFTNKENMTTEDGIIIGWNPDKVWRSAVMEMYGRLSCPAVNPVTEVVTVKDSMCDAGCSVLSALGLAAVVPSGTGVQGGQLSFVDGWHGECRISGGPLDGQCKANTVCPPGQEKFSENGVWKCRSTTLTQTAMPWVRVILDSITVLRPPGTALPW